MVSHYTKDFLSYFLTLFPLIYSSFSTTSLAPVIKFPFLYIIETAVCYMDVFNINTVIISGNQDSVLTFSLVTLSRYTWRTTGGKLLSHFSRFSYCRLIFKTASRHSPTSTLRT